jgi:hypothetical protein
MDVKHKGMEIDKCLERKLMYITLGETKGVSEFVVSVAPGLGLVCWVHIRLLGKVVLTGSS